MPANRLPYRHAPITEAVIDIRTSESPNSPDLNGLGNLQLGNNYLAAEPLHINTGELQLGPSPSAIMSSQQIGYVYKSPTQNYVLQVQPTAFALSRLVPYENWDSFSAEARRLWAIYESVANPTHFLRLAVRYVNRINIPLPINDFKEYLRTVPEVSSDLPQGLAGYVMQLSIPLEDINGKANITEMIIPPVTNEIVPILLDIDIFIEGLIPTNTNVLWDMLARLRDKKNEIFEACITDKTRELFN